MVGILVKQVFIVFRLSSVDVNDWALNTLFNG